MSKARRTEGPCAPLFYCVLVAAAWRVGPAWSQSVDLADLEACAALPADDQKIACINAMIAAERDESATTAEPVLETPAIASAPAAAEKPAASPEAAAGPVPAAEPVRAGPAIAPPAPTAAPTEAMPVTNGRADEPAPPFPAPVAAPPVDVAQGAAANAPADDVTAAFGSEQLQREDDRRPDFVENTVVDVTRANNKALVFHMADGQVWRQIEPRRYPYPRNGEFAVTISQGMMGEYRMRIGNNGRMVRIRRIK